jgi:hypothetical protein
MLLGTMLLSRAKPAYLRAIMGTFGCFCPTLSLHTSEWTRQVSHPHVGKHKLVWAELRPEDQEPVFR